MATLINISDKEIENKFLKNLVKHFIEYSAKQEKKIDFLQEEVRKYDDFNWSIIIPRHIPSIVAKDFSISPQMIVSLVERYRLFEKEYFAIRIDRSPSKKNGKSQTTVLLSDLGVQVLKAKIDESFEERMKEMPVLSDNEREKIEKSLMKLPSYEEINWTSREEI